MTKSEWQQKHEITNEEMAKIEVILSEFYGEIKSIRIINEKQQH